MKCFGCRVCDIIGGIVLVVERSNGYNFANQVKAQIPSLP